jgi:hypothetical protein
MYQLICCSLLKAIFARAVAQLPPPIMAIFPLTLIPTLQNNYKINIQNPAKILIFLFTKSKHF